MDGIEVQLFGTLCDINTHRRRAVLTLDTHRKILLGGGTDDLTQKLRKMRRMLRLFKRRQTEELTDLRIAFTDRRTAHRKIHTDLGALTVKACT